MRNKWVMVGLSVTALLLASCSTATNGASTTTTTESATGAGDATSSETSQEPNADASPVIIGLTVPLSGTAAGLGENEKNGASLAIDIANAAGGVAGGHPIELTSVDNECNPTTGVSSINRLIDQDKAVAIIGALCSGVTLAIMPILEESEVPLVVGVSSSPDIEKQAGVGGNTYTFRTGPSDAALATGLAEYLSENTEVKRVAILGEDGAYGRIGSDALTAALEPAGISVISADFAPLGTSDFSTVIAKYQRDQPDVIALYIEGADHLNFLKQAQSAGLEIPVTGRVEMEGENLDVLKSPGFAGSTSVYPYGSAIDTAANRDFVEKFVAKYGHEPTNEAFAGYQVALVLIDALNRADDLASSSIRDALADTGLESVKGGKISFDDHNQAHDVAFILGIEGGEVIVITDVNT